MVLDNKISEDYKKMNLQIEELEKRMEKIRDDIDSQEIYESLIGPLYLTKLSEIYGEFIGVSKTSVGFRLETKTMREDMKKLIFKHKR